MEKVKIKICCGTSCFVMGAAQIQVLEFAPPADIADKIEIEEGVRKLYEWYRRSIEA